MMEHKGLVKIAEALGCEVKPIGSLVLLDENHQREYSCGCGDERHDGVRGDTMGPGMFYFDKDPSHALKWIAPMMKELGFGVDIGFTSEGECIALAYPFNEKFQIDPVQGKGDTPGEELADGLCGVFMKVLNLPA